MRNVDWSSDVCSSDLVLAHLALVDDAPLVLVQELHRVLDGHDVAVAGPVDLVDDGSERGGLPRPGGTRDQDEAALEVSELADHSSEEGRVGKASVSPCRYQWSPYH